MQKKKNQNPQFYLNRLKYIAAKNNAQLISSQWNGSWEKYEFLLNDGRIYRANSVTLISNGWPKNIEIAISLEENYTKTNEKKLQELKYIAENNNGFLISNKFTKITDNYIFAFADGTQFERSGYSMKKYGWPKTEQDKYIKNYSRKDIEHLKELISFAKNNGAELLSQDWQGIRGSYLFEKNGKQFTAKLANLRQNGFPKDVNHFLNRSSSATNTNEEKLEKLRQLAIKHGGELLSKNWHGASELYEFYDYKTKQNFQRTYSSVRNGYWTFDRGLIIEPICRQIFEHIFQKEFIKTRDILTTEIIGRKNPLELDGYCAELKIAFEYQGHPSHWDKSHENYEKTHKRDNLKKKFCENLSITLIEIPTYEKSNIKDEDIFNYVASIILKKFVHTKLKIPLLNVDNFKIDFSKISHSMEHLEKLQKIAEKHNGKLISTSWKGHDNKYLFENNKGEEFLISPKNLTSRGWPNDIKKYQNGVEFRQKDNDDLLDDLRLIAKKNGGELISNTWLGSKSKYLFKKDEKVFSISPGNLKTRGWPEDINSFLAKSKSRSQTDIEKLGEIQFIAAKHNGKILDNEWKGDNYKYTCEFKDGQQFKIMASFLKRNGDSWPKNINSFLTRSMGCSQTDIEKLGEIQSIATKHNGKILDNEWKGNTHKYTCEFEDGQQFKIAGSHLKRNGDGWPKNQAIYLKFIKSKNRL